MPGGSVTENSPMTVSRRARPYNTVDISAELTTTTFVNQKTVVYVRSGTTGSGVHPHTLPEAKRLPACHKGVRECVARTVVKRVSKTVALYHTAMRVHADRKGHFSAKLRLRYRTSRRCTRRSR